jgi:hypothetical protein
MNVAIAQSHPGLYLALDLGPLGPSFGPAVDQSGYGCTDEEADHGRSNDGETVDFHRC